jgi:SET domain-containing protein
MKKYIVKKTKDMGYGVFAAIDIKGGECILRTDISRLKRYSLKKIGKMLKNDPELDGDHSDYAGHGKYVIDHSPGSYVNHSCDPNCHVKMRTLVKKDLIASRNIRKGEELTKDYQATSTDQFVGKGFWEMDCKCGAKNCRKRVTGDFFRLPKKLQRIYYQNLPSYVKRKYRDRFNRLKK